MAIGGKALIVAALRWMLVIFNNLYCIPAYFMWCVILLPLKYLSGETYWLIESFLYKWLLAQVSYWAYTGNYRVLEYNVDDIKKAINERALVIANHQSTADVPTLIACFVGKGGYAARRVVWVMDVMFRWTQFGLVSQVHGDFFIQQGKEVRERMIDEFKNYLKSVYLTRNRLWLVLFPEGGFLRNRLEKSKEYARKNGFPVLEHITLPRLGAIQAIMNTCGPKVVEKKLLEKAELNDENVEIRQRRFSATPWSDRSAVKYLVDVTIGYEGRVLSMMSFIGGHRAPARVHVHYRCFPASEIPMDDTEMRDYFYKLYAEKDELLEYFYKNDHFPTKVGESVPAEDNSVGFLYMFYSIFCLLLSIF